ncbi:MAG: hypothetical protein GY909_06290 [Oligoflexia bacterium]|nr:hypothetical protein [Oligoflexia bacterium]
MSRVYLKVLGLFLLSFQISQHAMGASLPSCEWKAPSDSMKNGICDPLQGSDLLGYNSCYESVKVYKDSIGRVKFYKYDEPMGASDLSEAQNTCSDFQGSDKNACMRMVSCSMTVDEGELKKSCQAPSSIPEEIKAILSMPLNKQLPIAYVNGKALMGEAQIKAELCNGQDDSCLSDLEINIDDSGLVTSKSKIQSGTPDQPAVSKAKEECKKRYDEGTFNYNHCVRMIKCPASGCVYPEAISPDSDDMGLGSELTVSCLDEGDSEGDVVTVESNDNVATAMTSPSTHRQTANEQAFENCESKKGRSKFLCYMASLGQRPEKLIEACSISQERYEDFLESLDERDGANAANR